MRRISSFLPHFLLVVFVFMSAAASPLCRAGDIRGKSHAEWIKQAEKGETKQKRMKAIIVLRSDCLKAPYREKTLKSFTGILLDKDATIQMFAASGIHIAGLPTDPKAADNLVKVISTDLTQLKPPPNSEPDKPIALMGKFGAVARSIAALSYVGEKPHIPPLRKIAENEKVHHRLRKIAARAVLAIEKRIGANDDEN